MQLWLSKTFYLKIYFYFIDIISCFLQLLTILVQNYFDRNYIRKRFLSFLKRIIYQDKQKKSYTNYCQLFIMSTLF